MKAAGFVLFVAGIVGAITFGAKLSPVALEAFAPPAPVPSDGPATADAAARPDRFPDTRNGFFAGAALAAVGLALWWKAEFSTRKKNAAEEPVVASGGIVPAAASARISPLKVLDDLQQPLETLAADSARLSDPADLLPRIDGLLDGFVQPLVEHRQRALSRLGMVAGSEVLVATAGGERLLNRAWSAAADGHLAEAVSSLAAARDAFRRAQELAHQATSTPS